MQTQSKVNDQPSALWRRDDILDHYYSSNVANQSAFIEPFYKLQAIIKIGEFDSKYFSFIRQSL